MKDCQPNHFIRQCLSPGGDVLSGLTSERQQIILDSLGLVERVSALVDTTSYLWGGMALDAYAGRLLRNHHDLDYLTLDLHELIVPLRDAFEAEGCMTKELVNGDLKIAGTGIGIHLGHIEIGKQVHWIHNPASPTGELCFPRSWLSPKRHLLYDTLVHAVEPELEYVLKSQPELLNPQWSPRSKDILALEETKAILEKRDVDLNELQSLVSIDSPITGD